MTTIAIPRLRKADRAVWSDAERDILRPPEDITVSQWTDRNRVLDARTSSEPGQWHTDRTPYLRGIMDAFTDPRIERITIVASTQVGKTESWLNMLGYLIDQDPGPTLVVMPRVDDTKAISTNRIQPMLQLSPALRRRLPRLADDLTHLEYRFAHMLVHFAGSNSPAGLAGRPIRNLFLDEVDKFPPFAGREADPIMLAMQRTQTYWDRKIVACSTPTTKAGYIWREYEASDQRRYLVPCPHCAHEQALVFDQVKWPKGADADAITEGHLAWYECESCKGRIEDRQKPGMLTRGHWQAEGTSSNHAGFWLNALYSPWLTYSAVASEFLRSKGHPELLMNFVNSWLAQLWEERGEAANEEVILARRDVYHEGTIPEMPLALILTSDVQQDCLYYVIRAWGMHETSWGTRYGVVPDRDALDVVLASTYTGPGGEPLRVTHAGQDAGYDTDAVYEWCARTGAWPLFGRDTTQQSQPLRWSKVDGRSVLHLLSPYFKDSLQRKFHARSGDPGAWYLHAETGLEYAKQLTAEVVVEKKDTRGRPVRVWKQIRPENHWLDCEVYQLAMALALGIRYLKAPLATETPADPAKPKATEVKGKRWNATRFKV